MKTDWQYGLDIKVQDSSTINVEEFELELERMMQDFIQVIEDRLVAEDPSRKFSVELFKVEDQEEDF